jgi:hypothetical protein
MPLPKNAKPEDWIKDFVHSDNPKFKGKDKKKRIKMALAAYYAHKAAKLRKKNKEKRAKKHEKEKAKKKLAPKKKKKSLKENVLLELSPEPWEPRGEKHYHVNIAMVGIKGRGREVHVLKSVGGKISANNLEHAKQQVKEALPEFHKHHFHPALHIIYDRLSYLTTIHDDHGKEVEGPQHHFDIIKWDRNEDAAMAVNNIGGGNIDGAGIGPKGEPGIRKKKRPILFKTFRRQQPKI